MPGIVTSELHHPPPRKRSGTEMRHRSRLQVGVRLDDDEYEIITALAEQAGMSLADYLRWAAIGKRVRLRHRPEKPDAAQARMIRELLGQAGRIGNNVNQMAKQANIAARSGQSARAEVAALDDLHATIMAWKTELREILGVRELEE